MSILYVVVGVIVSVFIGFLFGKSKTTATGTNVSKPTNLNSIKEEAQYQTTKKQISGESDKKTRLQKMMEYINANKK